MNYQQNQKLNREGAVQRFTKSGVLTAALTVSSALGGTKEESAAQENRPQRAPAAAADTQRSAEFNRGFDMGVELGLELGEIKGYVRLLEAKAEAINKSVAKLGNSDQKKEWSETYQKASGNIKLIRDRLALRAIDTELAMAILENLTKDLAGWEVAIISSQHQPAVAGGTRSPNRTAPAQPALGNNRLVIDQDGPFLHENAIAWQIFQDMQPSYRMGINRANKLFSDILTGKGPEKGVGPALRDHLMDDAEKIRSDLEKARELRREERRRRRINEKN